MAFWNKNEDTRINETVAWIAAKAPPAQRFHVQKFLTNFLTSSFYPAEVRKRLSKMMSTSGFSNTGNEETRHGRRALVILARELIDGSHPRHMEPPEIMTMAAAGVAPLVRELISNLCIFALQETGSTGSLEFHLNELTTRPEEFLAKHDVLTQSANTPTGIGSQRLHRFQYEYKHQRFLIMAEEIRNPPPPPKVPSLGILMQAVNVPELFWFNVPGRGNTRIGSFARIPCTELTGNLMVTSLFNGCTFCFKRTGGSTFAAHIAPDGQLRPGGTPADNIGPPPTLARQIGTGGNFNDNAAAAAAGPLHVYGRGFSNLAGRQMEGGYFTDVALGGATKRKVCIIGTRVRGIWRFVAQEYGEKRARNVITLP